MAIESVSIINKTAETDLKGTRVTVTYLVVSDSPVTDITDILTASDGTTSVPQIGDSWQGSTTIRCKRVGPAQQVSASTFAEYTVTAHYDNINQGGTSVVEANPLNRPADISYSFDVVQRVVEKDRDDNAVVNSAGDMFDPPITDEVYRFVITIERNVAATNPATVASYVNTVNSDAITVAGVALAAEQGLIKDYSARAVYEADTEYIRERIMIQVAESHAREVADAGYYYIDASDGNKRKHVTDGEGRDDTKPHYLTATGDDGGTTPRYLTFNIKEAKAWAPLGLPTGFPDV
ncbi:MAG: hypothetical protein D6744_00845 [Planctomycetota bacterium]|nr:MAG: hypothetical protein D6744_00845 [Planctomycetota bacterium]